MSWGTNVNRNLSIWRVTMSSIIKQFLKQVRSRSDVVENWCIAAVIVNCIYQKHFHKWICYRQSPSPVGRKSSMRMKKHQPIFCSLTVEQLQRNEGRRLTSSSSDKTVAPSRTEMRCLHLILTMLSLFIFKEVTNIASRQLSSSFHFQGARNRWRIKPLSPLRYNIVVSLEKVWMACRISFAADLFHQSNSNILRSSIISDWTVTAAFVFCWYSPQPSSHRQMLHVQKAIQRKYNLAPQM